eukprot:7010049-Pyramimonas_sp.AAC.1
MRPGTCKNGAGERKKLRPSHNPSEGGCTNHTPQGHPRAQMAYGVGNDDAADDDDDCDDDGDDEYAYEYDDDNGAEAEAEPEDDDDDDNDADYEH